jgi:hypothetical protein
MLRRTRHAANGQGVKSKARQVGIAWTTFFVALAASLCWIQIVDRLRAPDPGPLPGTAAGIVWAGRVFHSEAELAGWLGRRGIDYERWVTAHPAAISRLRPQQRSAAAAPSAATGGKGASAVAGTARAALSRPAARAERTSTPARPSTVAAPSAPRPEAGRGFGTPLSIAMSLGALALLLALVIGAVGSTKSTPFARLIRLGPRTRAAADRAAVGSGDHPRTAAQGPATTRPPDDVDRNY